MNKKKYSGIILEDIGLLTFLLSIFCTVVIIARGGYGLFSENCVMIFLASVAIIFVTFSKNLAAFVITGSQLIGYTAYKIFNFYANGTSINVISYAWLVLPIIMVGSMRVFCAGRNRLELENGILRNQVEELVMIDPLTGTYNLRSFYHDINRQISYTKRNKLPLTLMLIKLRYGEELKKILTKKQYDILKQRFAQIVTDAIRIEDKLYSIDDEGSMAVILTCDDDGSNIVKNRIRAMVGEKKAFDGIIDALIKVEVKIAFIQYNESMGNDMISYKNNVEKELQYDV